MIELTSKDKIFLRSFWPWGAIYALVVSIAVVASWFFEGRWVESFGFMFFVVLVIPFAWWGLAEYFDWLVFRGVKKINAKIVVGIYLAMLAGKQVISYGPDGVWSVFVAILLGLAVLIYWMGYADRRGVVVDQLSFKTPLNLTWLADVSIFLVVFLLVVIS